VSAACRIGHVAVARVTHELGSASRLQVAALLVGGDVGGRALVCSLSAVCQHP
jgi:hypothetical protein